MNHDNDTADEHHAVHWTSEQTDMMQQEGNDKQFAWSFELNLNTETKQVLFVWQTHITIIIL